MPNPYFRFKQFTIQQDRSAMKVCTDSCILGAWTARRVKNSKRVLDIGTGTGLLALMLAQKTDAQIDAIESDTDAAQQAEENITASDWPKRIRVIRADVRSHVFEVAYDFIVCNPPFYEGNLPSPERKKNAARHDESLMLKDIIHIIGTALKPTGSFSILLPFHRTDDFENLAREHSFFLADKLVLRQTPAHSAFRGIGRFQRIKPHHIAEEELTIRDDKGNHSHGLLELMKDYYL